MMFLKSRRICFILTMLCFTVSTGDKLTASRGSIRMSIKPRRLYVFESSVRLTVTYSEENQGNRNITRFVKIQIFNNNQKVWTIDKMVRPSNRTTLEVPCEIFSKPGAFYIQYFVEGITKVFRKMRKNIFVQRQNIRLHAPNNHTAVSGSVVVKITNNKYSRCKSGKNRVQLYWIKGVNNHVLVTSKKIGKDKNERRIRVQFNCNIFDTEGIFYFKYTSANSNAVLATSNNMTVFWGTYKLEPQSNSIFPCGNSFSIKITSPYCAKSIEDKVELRSKDYDNVIETRSAYPGFKSVFLPCITFKRYIRNYCFYYLTKSSLTKKETIQAKLCLPSLKTESNVAHWGKWSTWGSCFSPTNCGQGRKLRVRVCEITSYYSNTGNSPCGKGLAMDSTSCILPPCKLTMGCEFCGCVFTKPDGTIFSPEFLTSFSTRNKSNCQWWIKVEANKTVKLWFNTLRLARNSVVHILDGNHSNSKILERLTHEKQKINGDIFGSSNIIAISYYFDGNLNGTNSGFQLSYSSIEKSTPNHPEFSNSQKKRLVKMTFVGILALLVVVMAGIFLIIFCKMRQHACDEKSKTSVSQPTSSFHTSTACMSDSTLRSSFETPASGDESMNNNFTLQRVNRNYRARDTRQARMKNRTYVHVCPKCHDTDICNIEYQDSGNTLYHDLGSLSLEESARLTSYGDSYCGAVVVESAATRARNYSAIESFRTASSLSDEVANTHYPRYL